MSDNRQISESPRLACLFTLNTKSSSHFCSSWIGCGDGFDQPLHGQNVRYQPRHSSSSTASINEAFQIHQVSSKQAPCVVESQCFFVISNRLA